MVVEQQASGKTPGTSKEAQRTEALRFTLGLWLETMRKLDGIKFWWEEGQSLLPT